MIEARVTLDGPQKAEALRRAHLRGLQRATAFLWSEIQAALNVPNTGVRVRRKHRRGSYTIYPDPSRPGEPPRKRTGYLQRNVTYSVNASELTARVGLTANADYGVHLEVGTSRMEPRPWLFSTAQKARPQMARILAAEVSGG